MAIPPYSKDALVGRKKFVEELESKLFSLDEIRVSIDNKHYAAANSKLLFNKEIQRRINR